MCSIDLGDFQQGGSSNSSENEQTERLPEGPGGGAGPLSGLQGGAPLVYFAS